MMILCRVIVASVHLVVSVVVNNRQPMLLNENRTSVLLLGRHSMSCVAVAHSYEELRPIAGFLPMMLPHLSELCF